MHLSGLITNLATLRERMEEQKVVEKYLRVVPMRFLQIALSIETLLYLLTHAGGSDWRLKVVKDRLDPKESPVVDGKLLTEEQWLVCKERKQGEGSSGSDNLSLCSSTAEERGRQRL